MRFMIIVKNDPATENQMGPPEMFEAMSKYNQSLVDAGILLAAEGLSGSKDGAIVSFHGGKTSVKDGPFTEAKELVAGFWIIQVRDLSEAVAWAQRIPFDEGGAVEVRRVSELSDFEGVMSDEAVAREKSIADQISNKPN